VGVRVTLAVCRVGERVKLCEHLVEWVELGIGLEFGFGFGL